MRRSSVYGRDKGRIGFNMTPMIDVTFLLMIFFILAGSFASLDVMKLTVPRVHGDRTVDELKLPHKLVVNIPPFPADRVLDEPDLAGRARMWKVSTHEIRPGDGRRLLAVLQGARDGFLQRQAKDPSLAGVALQVELRADRSLHYSQVAPALAAIGKAGFSRVHYVACGSPEER